MEQRESPHQYQRPSSMSTFRASHEPGLERRALRESSKLKSSKSETECEDTSQRLHQPSQRPAFRAPQEPFTAKDFVYGEILGLGSYSKVVKAKKKDTGVTYALKIMDKLHIVKENKTVYVKLERIILDQLDHPGVVQLFFTFQDAHYLYMGLECCDGGELFDQIQRKKQLSLDEARFYASELVEVMEYLHGQGLIHRDLKPENLLLTKDGHLKVADFGSAKVLRPFSNGIIQNLPDDKCCTFVGTAEYVSPEVLNSLPVTIGVDLWALGCILYQMLVGRPPFKCASEYLTFQKVMARDFKLPDHLAPEAKNLINSLLDMDPNKRPGAGPDGYSALKAHPFFHGIEWTQLRKLRAPPVVSLSDPESIEDGWMIDDDDALDSEWDFAHIGGTPTQEMTSKASNLKNCTENSSNVVSKNLAAPFVENVMQKMSKLNVNEPHLSLNQTGCEKGQYPRDSVELETESISPANSSGGESLISVTGGDVQMDNGPECLNRPMSLKV